MMLHCCFTFAWKWHLEHVSHFMSFGNDNLTGSNMHLLKGMLHMGDHCLIVIKRKTTTASLLNYKIFKPKELIFSHRFTEIYQKG